MSLERAAHRAVERAGRRPGLLVIGAMDGPEAAVSSAGTLPGSDTVAERVVFEIGSVTKVFTGLLLAIAVERGAVGLDDPVADHLPAGTSVPRGGDGPITLLHLATHTSGLPRLPPGMLLEGLRHRADPYAHLTPEVALEALGRTRLRAAPGQRFRYSNFGAGVLGLALAHSAGTDYGSLVRERITRPLGMDDTVITLDVEQRARLATGTRRRGRPTGLWTITGLAGAGALRSTVADLITFVHAQMGILPPGASEELSRAIAMTHVERPARTRLAPAMRIGLGWLRLPMGRAKLATLFHNGGTGGYRSFVGWAPASRSAAIVLSSNARSVDRIGSRLLLDLAAQTPDR